MELWGGIECTVNRIGAGWRSQMALSGHARRDTDLNLVAGLGIRALRYPVLWELTHPRPDRAPDWRWADERLYRLRELGIEPIVGFVHHGSGPSHTNLLDLDFAPRLAEFAARVAERYPWLRRFTPVNEPMTTARFSALYGHWYPHRRDDVSFMRAFVNQCRAVVLCMQAIRRSIPDAGLVQTEDLGTTYSTPHMRYQRDFDNERRWLTWDLLCGRVDAAHPLQEFLVAGGVTVAELEWFAANACPPQLLGINHYVTSDRFLDERVGLHPGASRGRNAHEAYADVEAVRMLEGDYRGWGMLEGVWQRYGIPLAITEAHLACTREEQMRWFLDAWEAARHARAGGCEVTAVTAWSLFGAFDWQSLLTRSDGSYEPGAFDVRAPEPRPTAVARMLEQLSRGSELRHPATSSTGWWHRNVRRRDEAAIRVQPARYPARSATERRPVLVCGAGGTLGLAIVRACEERNLPVVSLGRKDLDICDAPAVERTLRQSRPWAIVNAAGYVRVDQAEAEASRCFVENAVGPEVLARAAGEHGVPLLTFSSDLVFDGTERQPYVESSSAAPLNVYGSSKLAAEEAVLAYERSLCVRTAAFFGAWGRSDFLSDVLCALAAGETVTAMEDVVVSPTFLPDLVHASLDLLIDECSGLYHLTNRGAVSWADFARRAAAALEVGTRSLVGTTLEASNLAARRPRFSALDSERVFIMPSLDDALSRYARAASAAGIARAPMRRSG